MPARVPSEGATGRSFSLNQSRAQKPKVLTLKIYPTYSYRYQGCHLSPREPPHFGLGVGSSRPSAAQAASGTAAPGYGPGAGSGGVPSPEGSTRDVGSIFPSSGEPLNPVTTRVEHTPREGSLTAVRACLPQPGPRLRFGAGRRLGPSLAPGDAWAPAQGHHVGLQVWQGAPETSTLDCSPRGPQSGPKLA